MREVPIEHDGGHGGILCGFEHIEAAEGDFEPAFGRDCRVQVHEGGEESCAQTDVAEQIPRRHNIGQGKQHHPGQTLVVVAQLDWQIRPLQSITEPLVAYLPRNWQALLENLNHILVGFVG